MSPTANDSTAPMDGQSSQRVRWGVAGVIGLVGAIGVSAFMVIPGVSATPSDKVTICHATSAAGNPYVVNTISTSSVDEAGNKYLNGHGDHTGPAFTSGMTSGWGDIIPPFTDAESGVSFPGYNWTSAGQAIWDAGCTVPSASPTPTPTTTSPTPTPTTTSPTPTPTTTSPTPSPTSAQVTICHATASTGNPYTTNSIDSSSIDEEGNQYLNGHGDHTGPVFTPGMTSGWGDIIPPFTHGTSTFPGYNWSSAGQAIWENQCAYTTPSPTPTPTETSSSPTPTPTTTSPTPTPTTTSPTPTPITTSPAPITTSPAPITTSPAPTPTPTPTETSATPTPTTTSPAPITTSPAPITTSPAPTPTSTTSVSPTPIVTPSVDGTPTPPAPATTDNPNPSGGLPTAVAAGGGPGDTPQGRPAWLWLVAAAFLALLIASLRQLAPRRDVP